MRQGNYEGYFTVKKIYFGSDWLSNATYDIRVF
jgi:hypothetical protein